MADEPLVFASEEALLAAITAGLVPAQVLGQPVEYVRGADGRIWVWPGLLLAGAQGRRDGGDGGDGRNGKVDGRDGKDGEMLARLAAAGAARAPVPAELRGAPRSRARMWPELIAPRRLGSELAAGSVVLFAMMEGAGEAGRSARSLLELAAELVRLGCHQCTYQLVARAEEGGASGHGQGSGDSRHGQGSGQADALANGLPSQQVLALVRAYDPPYYTVAACTEPGARFRAFVPAVSTQARTWIEVGYEHPLAAGIVPPEGQLCLIPGQATDVSRQPSPAGATERSGESPGAWPAGWLHVTEGPWRDLFDLVEIVAPAAEPCTPIQPSRKLAVPLRLAPATRAEPPSLWVLRGTEMASAVDRVDMLVQTLPDELIGRLAFAVLAAGGNDRSGAGEVVVLRARHGRSGPPLIDVDGVAMVPYLGLPNLYVPHGALVEPPLGRDTLRALLAPDAERLYWLAPLVGRPELGLGPGGNRGFCVESTPERAFAPLRDWIEYVIHTSAGELAPWVRSVTFELEPFRSMGAEWGERSPSEPDVPPGQRRKPGRVRELPPIDQVTQGGERNAEPRPIESSPAIEIVPLPPVEPMAAQPSASEAEAALADLERGFLDLQAPADAPARTSMWLAMARLHVRLEQQRDAALCFVRAAWELPGALPDGQPELGAVLTEWAAAEARAVTDKDRPRPRASSDSDADPDHIVWWPLRLRRPNIDQVRAVAVHWIATVATDLPLATLPRGTGRSSRRSLTRALGEVQQWFDAHDSELDVRTMWLLRWSLARHAGGDPLGLARARDRVVARLQTGLSVERDVPTFLRFLGSRRGGDAAAVIRLVQALESLAGLFERTRRTRSPVEAPAALTGAYVALVVAYGFARLGRADRARELRHSASSRLDLKDPVHSVLVRAYSARIDQALEGLPPETPLPAAIAGMLSSLKTMDRFKADRLRESSLILEPQQRVAAWRGFLQAGREPGSTDLAELAGLAPGNDSDELATAVERLAQTATSDATAIDDRVRLLDGLMDVLPNLPGGRAVPVLRSLVTALDPAPPPRRVELLEKALLLAGYFGKPELAGRLADELSRTASQLEPAEAARLAPELGRCLRNLRRFGLGEQTAALVDTLSSMAFGEDVAGVEARLYVAAGMVSLGDLGQAEPIIAGTQAALPSMKLLPMDRVRLVRALALAWSQCSAEMALSGLAQLAGELAHITDMFPTNSHFCLSVIAFMEALVLGYVMGDLSLGELGRRWLDEDEYLVRRRIHREFGGRS